MTALGAAFPTHNNLQPDHVVTAPAVSLFTGPVVTYSPLADGVEGTIQSLDAMRRAVLGGIAPDFSGWQDVFNISAAKNICSRVTGQTPREQIAALFNFCRDQITYLEHPWNMQVVKDCRRTLESREGDCVSKSVCLATLLACLGLRSRFIAQCADGESFDHVYVEAFLGGQSIALDPTADGRDGRPLGNVGWSQSLPDGGFEMAYTIFF